jgi:toxin-antitoxin system PIN domain toxin
MRIVDLNILLYAVNRDTVHHQRIRPWWEAMLSQEEPVGLTWMVLLGFLRLSTNAHVFPKPLTPAQATKRIERWLACPNVRIVQEAEEHWRILRSLIDQSGTSANLTTDAHLAAIAIGNGAELVSCDTDFARFRSLRWSNPLDDA